MNCCFEGEQERQWHQERMIQISSETVGGSNAEQKLWYEVRIIEKSGCLQKNGYLDYKLRKSDETRSLKEVQNFMN